MLLLGGLADQGWEVAAARHDALSATNQAKLDKGVGSLVCFGLLTAIALFTFPPLALLGGILMFLAVVYLAIVAAAPLFPVVLALVLALGANATCFTVGHQVRGTFDGCRPYVLRAGVAAPIAALAMEPSQPRTCLVCPALELLGVQNLVLSAGLVLAWCGFSASRFLLPEV